MDRYAAALALAAIYRALPDAPESVHASPDVHHALDQACREVLGAAYEALPDTADGRALALEALADDLRGA